MANAETGVVTVVVAWPEGETETQQVTVTGPTSVEQLMQSDELEAWKPQIKGAGSTAFLTSLGDFSTAAGKGWTFKIDGQWSERGIGQTELMPGTKLSWSYGTFEDATSN